ncbi:uncharacterized protein LOC143257868 [Tachypleus tridentatus]|uniref:uncharacterized protein LOC143257868 n=1 Tax=Tachypleus tridentatus TaxID=6853 RepID=UPI003FD51840
MASSPTESFASFFGISTKRGSNCVNTRRNESNVSDRDEKLEKGTEKRTDSHNDTSDLNDLNLQLDKRDAHLSVTEHLIQQSSIDLEEYANVDTSYKLSPPVGSYSDEKSCQDSIYSDEFESDSLSSNAKTAKKKLTKIENLLTNSTYLQVHGKHGSSVSKSQRSSQASWSNQSTGHRERTYVTQRLLSARRLKINELRNELENTQRQVREVEQENRFLKRLQLKQERELARLQSTKGELPEMLQSHSEEVRVLKKLLNKAKEKIKDQENKIKVKDDQLNKFKDDTNKLRKLASNRNLLERDKLREQVESLELEIRYRDTSIQDLTKKLNLANKNHKHELAAEVNRCKELKSQVSQLQDESEKLQASLKEKERELHRMNIYSNALISTECRSTSVATNSVTSTPTHQKQRGFKPKKMSHKMGKKTKSLSLISRDESKEEEFDKEDEICSSSLSTHNFSLSRRDEELKSNVEIAKQAKDVQHETPQDVGMSTDINASVELNDFKPLLLKGDFKERVFQTSYHEVADQSNHDSPMLTATSRSSECEREDRKKQQTEVNNGPEFPVLDLTNPLKSINQEDKSNKVLQLPFNMKEVVVSDVRNKDVLEDNLSDKSLGKVNTSFEHPLIFQQKVSSGHFQRELDQNKKEELLVKLKAIDKGHSPLAGSSIDKGYGPFTGYSSSSYPVRSTEKSVVSETPSSNQSTFLPSVQRSDSRRFSEGSATDISFGSYKPSFGFGTAFLNKPSSKIFSADFSSYHSRNKKKAELMASLFSTESKIQPNKIKEHNFDNGYDKDSNGKRFNSTQYFKGHYSTGSSLSILPDTETKNFDNHLQSSQKCTKLESE